MISVIVPTIKGREHWLERCKVAYAASTRDYELIVIEDKPTCNMAWNLGIRHAIGEYIHLSADDLEPHSGWLEAALGAVAQGFLPCPRVLNSDGTLQSCGNTDQEAADGEVSDVARVPFFPAHLTDAIYPILNTQYLGDYWVTNRARKVGWETRVVRDMVFTHHLAPEGRKETLNRDYAEFRRRVRNL